MSAIKNKLEKITHTGPYSDKNEAGVGTTSHHDGVADGMSRSAIDIHVFNDHRLQLQTAVDLPMRGRIILTWQTKCE